MRDNGNAAKIPVILLAVGLTMAVCGGVAGALLEETQHAFTRIAGMVCGMGTAFALAGGGAWLWRRRVGAQYAAERALEMSDERGQLMTYKAKNVTLCALMVTVLVLMGMAVVCGDWVYATVCLAGCAVSAAGKMLALCVYRRQM